MLYDQLVTPLDSGLSYCQMLQGLRGSARSIFYSKLALYYHLISEFASLVHLPIVYCVLYSLNSV